MATLSNQLGTSRFSSSKKFWTRISFEGDSSDPTPRANRKPLVVGKHVFVVPTACGNGAIAARQFEEGGAVGHPERGLRDETGGDHCSAFAQIEQLPATVRPDGLATSGRRDLPLAAVYVGERAHEYSDRLLSRKASRASDRGGAERSPRRPSSGCTGSRRCPRVYAHSPQGQLFVPVRSRGVSHQPSQEWARCGPERACPPRCDVVQIDVRYLGPIPNKVPVSGSIAAALMRAPAPLRTS